MWTFEWKIGWEHFDHYKLTDFWEQNFAQNKQNHVFYHPQMIFAWLQTYKTLRTLIPILCIAQKNDNIAFLPLCIWKMNWKNVFLKKLINIGYSDFDYADPHSSFSLTESELNDFWQQFNSQIPQTILRQIDIVNISGITANLQSEMKSTEQCPYLELSQFQCNIDNLLQSFSTSLRGDIRRQQRRMSEKGVVEFVVIQDIKDALLQLPIFLHHHTQRWKNAYKAPFFHENILKYTLEKKKSHFSVLLINKEPISWHLGFTFNKTFYYYMPAINMEFEKLSPGKVHLLKLHEWCLEKNYEIFDHLRGDENYKNGWASRNKIIYNHQFCLRGFLSSLKKHILKFKH